MKKLNAVLGAVTVLLLSAACSHQVTRFDGAQFSASSEAGGKGLVATPHWLKHKKNTIDAEVKLSNSYAFPVIIKQSSITMTYNGDKAIVRQMGRFSEQMEDGTSQVLVMIFDFRANNPAGGKATVIFNEVYKADGKTKLPPLKIEFTVEPIGDHV